jgi:PAS domain S-box-containing protein
VFKSSATDKPWSGRKLSRFWQKPWPLRTALGLFALSLVLPALLFFGLQYRAALVEKQQEVEREGRQLAHSAAADISRELAIKHAQLAALATSHALRTGDYKTFQAQASAALRESYGWIALVRGDGTTLMNTLAPTGTAFQSSQRSAEVRRVLQTGKSEETDVFVSRLTDRFVISVLYPVGYGDLVLSGVLPVEHFNDVLGLAVPTGWLATLIDRQGAVIARSQDPENTVGKSANPELWRHASSAAEGSTTLTSAADAGSFTTWAHLANGWTVAVHVPHEVLQQPMRAWERQVMLNVIFFSALAIVGAAAAGEWIARSMAHLAAAARTIGSGEVASPVVTSLREVNDVGDALRRASLDRQRAEVAMRESDMRFRAMFDQNTAGISLVDLAGRFRLVNARHCEITGYSESELRDKTLIDITHPDDRPRNVDLLKHMVADGRSYTIEKRFIRKDGKIVWVQVSSAAVRDSEGAPQYALGVVLDIDDRKRAEMANAHLAALVASSGDAIESLSLEGTILTWNRASEELYGYSAEEAIGQPFALIVPDDRRHEIARIIDAARAGDNLWLETARRRKDGSFLEVSLDVAPIRTNKGIVIGISTITRDISERRRQEAALQEREEQFRTLANSIPQLAWMANSDGHVVWYNDRWYEYTGTKPEQMEGEGWQRVYDPDTLPEVLERWKQSVRTGEPFDMTFRLKGADGVFRPFLTRVMPLRERSGIVARWFGTNTDITEQVEHEAQLNFVMRELSHRSKNLLAVVQAMARQTMQHSGTFEDFEGRFMGRLHGLARSHDVLVRQDWTGASIRELVRAQLAPFVREDGTSVEMSGDNLILRPDAVQNLGFALFELATNAVKYGALAAPSGKVTIRWERLATGEGKYVRFVWQESGGPPVDQPRRKGFGAMVIERFMAATFGGRVESAFLPQGFSWTLEIPVEHVLSEPFVKPLAAPRRMAVGADSE